MGLKAVRIVFAVALSATVLINQRFLNAQGVSGNGGVSGRVADATGAVIPGAEVTIIDQATNISTQLKTNSAGLFVFGNLAPGSYDVVVTKTGFRKTVLGSQTVVTGTALNLDITLEVGAASETVEVTSVGGA
jgi:hypothetical protein